MPDTVTFRAERRDILGKAVHRLRKQGIVPGNIFGGGDESVPVQLNEHAFSRFLATHPATTLLQLELDDGHGEMAVVRRVQHEPVTGDIQHVDFMRVRMNKPIRARIPVHTIGVAPAQKTDGGIPLILLESVEVEALPGNLPAALELDISDMEELNAAHSVRDLRVPPGVNVLTDLEEPVIKIEPPRAPAAEEVVEEAAAAEEAEEAAEARAEEETAAPEASESPEG